MSSEDGGKQAVLISLVALFLCLMSFFNSCDVMISTEKALATPEPLERIESKQVNVVDAEGTPVLTCYEIGGGHNVGYVGCVPFSVPDAAEVKK